MPTISLCMIVKNEEQFLEQCLNSVKDLVNEIVIVDTGSTDKTKEVAAKFTSKIIDFVWCDDFSAARNESLRHATGDWILILDADEVLEKSDLQTLKNALNNENIFAYSLIQLTYTNKDIKNPNFVAIEDKEFKGGIVSNIIRLFRNNHNISFDFFVHEGVDNSLTKNNLKSEHLNVLIHHYEELKGSSNVASKQKYYLKLLLKNVEKYPLHAKSYHDLAVLYNSHYQEVEKAIGYCKKAVQLAPEVLAYYVQLALLLRDLGKYDDAIDVLQKALTIKEDECVLRTLASVYYKSEKYKEAINVYEKVLALGSRDSFRIQQYIEQVKKEMMAKDN